jgi:(E)-4-hydroxy-3-methylbut-2-enyl-diphosphate synthase
VPELVERLHDMGVHGAHRGRLPLQRHLLLAKHPGCARALAKYRINPGNVGGKRRDENFRAIVQVAVAYDKPVRIGVNWGSLDQDLLTQMMDANAPRRRRARRRTSTWRR